MTKIKCIRIFLFLCIICTLLLGVSTYKGNNHPNAVSSRAMLV